MRQNPGPPSRTTIWKKKPPRPFPPEPEPEPEPTGTNVRDTDHTQPQRKRYTSTDRLLDNPMTVRSPVIHLQTPSNPPGLDRTFLRAPVIISVVLLGILKSQIYNIGQSPWLGGEDLRGQAPLSRARDLNPMGW